MKKGIVVLLLVMIFLLSACHNFNPEIEDKLEKDRLMIAARIEEDLRDDMLVEKNLKWVIQSNNFIT